MKQIAKKEYTRPDIVILDLPCTLLLSTSTDIDPYADMGDVIDIPLDDFQEDPDEGTFEAL